MILTDLNLYPPVFLAPMAGVTDTPSREIAQLFSPGLVVSEMIASSEKDKIYFEELVKANLSNAKTGKQMCPTAIQIAGHEIDWMTYAAKVIENEGGSLVDINMGCPAKKIVGKLAGSALMREPKQALKIIEAVVSSTSLPVTLKIRLGWDEESINAAMIAKCAEDSGIQMITVHGRTRKQFFKGEANWNMVQQVKNEVSIPVIVNGDIIDNSSAKLAVDRSFADGVMIGRGAIGKPWLLSDISKSLYKMVPKKAVETILLSELVMIHFDKILTFYGCKNGLRIFRKHLASYLKNTKINSSCCKDLLTEKSISKLESKLNINFSNNELKVQR